MRDKYIELIKEYIAAKPEYKLVLNEIKADVLTIGATEEEFDEAINQIADAETAKLILTKPPANLQPTQAAMQATQPTQPQILPTTDPLKKLTPLIWYLRDHVLTHKKYFAGGLAILVILLVMFLSLGKKEESKKTTSINR